MPLETTTEPVAQPLTDNIEPARDLVPWGSLPTLIKSDEEDAPDVKRPELIKMIKKWHLGDVLLEGTEAIKAEADQRLPPLGTDEEAVERDARIRKAVATPFYSDTIDRLVSRPFGRPITYGGDDNKLPGKLDALRKNADGRGKSMTALARDHLFQAIHRSGDCLLVDLASQAKPTSLGDQQKRRPVVKQIQLRDILGWEWSVDDDGETITTMLRLNETRQVKVGKWGAVDQSVVRIIQAAVPATATEPAAPGYSVVYYQNEDKDWILDAETAAEFVGERIMLHTTWTNQTTPTSGESPMTHLAELNMSYIAGDCEQQYGASYARVSTMYSTGMDSATAAGGGGQLGKNVSEMMAPVRKAPKRITRGHLRHIKLPSNESVGLLETSGGGLAAGRAELDNMEDRMERFGASHLAAAGVTATSIRSDDDRDTSNLRAWVGRVEDTLDAVLRDCAELVEEDLPEDFHIKLFRDWSQAEERQQAMPHVFAAYDRTLVPPRVVHEQLRRFGALNESDKTEDLVKEAQQAKSDRQEDDGNDDVTTAFGKKPQPDPDDQGDPITGDDPPEGDPEK